MKKTLALILSVLMVISTIGITTSALQLVKVSAGTVLTLETEEAGTINNVVIEVEDDDGPVSNPEAYATETHTATTVTVTFSSGIAYDKAYIVTITAYSSESAVLLSKEYTLTAGNSVTEVTNSIAMNLLYTYEGGNPEEGVEGVDYIVVGGVPYYTSYNISIGWVATSAKMIRTTAGKTWNAETFTWDTVDSVVYVQTTPEVHFYVNNYSTHDVLVDVEFAKNGTFTGDCTLTIDGNDTANTVDDILAETATRIDQEVEHTDYETYYIDAAFTRNDLLTATEQASGTVGTFTFTFEKSEHTFKCNGVRYTNNTNGVKFIPGMTMDQFVAENPSLGFVAIQGGYRCPGSSAEVSGSHIIVNHDDIGAYV